MDPVGIGGAVETRDMWNRRSRALRRVWSSWRANVWWGDVRVGGWCEVGSIRGWIDFEPAGRSEGELDPRPDGIDEI